MKDAAFTNTMNDMESQALNAFTEVAKKFLGDVKDPRYEEIVENMLGKLRVLEPNMSLKLQLLQSHLECFPDNLWTFSEEQSERFYQDLKETERRYEGRWDVNMHGGLLLVHQTRIHLAGPFADSKNPHVHRQETSQMFCFTS